MGSSSLFVKTFLVCCGLTAAAVAGVVAWGGWRSSQAAWTQERQRLSELAFTLAELWQQTPAEATPPQAVERLRRFAGRLQLEAVCLDRNGNVLLHAGDDEAAADNLRFRPEIQQAIKAQGHGSDLRVHPRTGQLTLFVAVAALQPNGNPGVARVASAAAPVVDRVRRNWWTLVGAGGLTWLLSVALAGIALHRLLRPLDSLAASAKSLAEGEAGLAILLDHRNDELGRLAEALNELRTGRLNRSDELREKGDLLLSVLQNMLEGVLAVDARENVLLANEASGRMLAFSSADAVGRPLLEVTRCRPLLATVQQAFATGRPSRGEFEATGDGRRMISVRAAALAGDRRHGVMIVMHDVTDLRRLENLRKEFVANVSHELKTPLASIKAYAETLRMGAIHDTEHSLGFVERIEEQAERLHQLIVDLLQLARVEAGREVFEFRELSLRKLAVECCEQFAAAAAARTTSLQVSDDVTDLTVHADEEGLRTILHNLIDNAVKYTPPGGRVRLFWRREGGHAVISVQDSGIGIAARDLGRIFERFFRVDKARSRELGGTGLGLSIVKHLAQALGGDVAVESQEGVGSTFRVKIPLADRSAAADTSERQ